MTAPTKIRLSMHNEVRPDTSSRRPRNIQDRGRAVAPRPLREAVADSNQERQRQLLSKIAFPRTANFPPPELMQAVSISFSFPPFH